ncbi:VOC family protein [Agrobacterium sp. YIC 4121]|uniref:VOC family protein n=1 Tax=Agrobacterium sp. YIC 4121 TaxID=1923829 RepID=UPI0011788D0C|nr:VOC family protein [Agrobacterium sp. YIC 4121]
MASSPTLEIIKVSEIKHLNILVNNLDISWAFYSEVLGFSYVNHLGPRKIAASFRGFDFFLEEAVDYQGKPDERIHFGIRTDRQGVLLWGEHLSNNGVTLVRGNNPEATIYEMPGTSRVALYFQDPDGWTIEVYSPE